MKTEKRQKIIRWLIVLFFICVVFTKNLYKQVHKVTSPNQQFSASVTASCGWNNVISYRSFRVEVTDNRSGEHLTAAVQPEVEGWNSFTPTGLKWGSRNNEFICLWGVPYNGVLSQVFTIKSNPLMTVSKSGIG